MSQAITWWAAASAISAAFTAVFVVATYYVYREIRDTMKQGNQILKETNRISRELGLKAARIQEVQNLPRLRLEFRNFGDPEDQNQESVTTWKVKNEGKGNARGIKLFEKESGAWKCHNLKAKPDQELLTVGGDTRLVLRKHSRSLNWRDQNEQNRLSVVAVYFDETDNGWVATYEGGRFVGTDRLESEVEG